MDVGADDLGAFRDRHLGQVRGIPLPVVPQHRMTISRTYVAHPLGLAGQRDDVPLPTEGDKDHETAPDEARAPTRHLEPDHIAGGQAQRAEHRGNRLQAPVEARRSTVRGAGGVLHGRKNPSGSRCRRCALMTALRWPREMSGHPPDLETPAAS